jgi:alpha-galactosidase
MSIRVLLVVLTTMLAGDASLPAQSPPTAPAISNTLALTPPMGWNSWNKFACNVSEEMIRSMADAMVKSDLKDAGYQYVNIDDCWQVSRAADGNIVPDPQRFPHGMKAVGDYIHSLGLKFGVYSDAGSKTCAGRPGGLGHEYQDAIQYAAWGVDYLKYDWCNTSTQDAKASYANIRRALDASGRAIVLSICEWGTAKPWLWGKEVGGNLWRTTGDITDRWAGESKWPDGSCCSNGMLAIVDQQVGLESFAGPGHWNDPDMLEVGNGGMTDAEYRAHFSLWAILAAPLIAGNDLREMRPEIHDILTNKEVIAIDQDPLGREGERVWKEGDREVWARQLGDGSRAVVLLNRGGTEQQISANWTDLGYPGHLSASVRDLWLHKELGNFTAKFSAPVASHAVVMVTVRP